MKGNVMNARRDMDTEKQHCQTETHTKERTKMGSETATVFTGALDFIYCLSNLTIRWKQNMTFLSAHKNRCYGGSQLRNLH